jgi:hypothetical protein
MSRVGRNFRVIASQYGFPFSLQGERIMKSRKLIGYVLLCSVLLIMFTMAAAFSFAAGNDKGNDRDNANCNAIGNAKVIPPEQNYEGLNYGEWAARWWQWFFSTPYADGAHPIFDTTGQYADIGQSGNVWFLGGVSWPNGGTSLGGATRTITVPAGTALFFPIVNSENNLVEAPGLTLQELWSTQNWLYPLKNNNMYATVDGKKVTNLTDYLTVSPVFGITLPDDNVLFAWAIPGASAGYVYPDVAAGYFLMLKPLPIGAHTITFGVKNLDWSMDIVYNVTVD